MNPKRERAPVFRTARLHRCECVARLQLHAHNRPYPAGLMRYGSVRNHQESNFADDKGIDADALRGDTLASWVFRLLNARRGTGNDHRQVRVAFVAHATTPKRSLK